ncbi:hypothetical protein ACFE04_030589 [Oxalis oulophora]
MSVNDHHYPELQVWNNAAFDCEEFDENPAAIKASWSSNESMDRSDSSCSKEDQIPNPIVNSRGEIFSLVSRQGLVDKSMTTTENGSEGVEKRKIDSEIEEIEREISRLSMKLEALRFEKLEHSVRSIEERGRIVPAKFVEPPRQISSKIEDYMFSSNKMKNANSRRGLSLGPVEIYNSVKSRQSILLTSKPDLNSTQSRRKSCFFKLQGIDQGKVTKERGKSLSVSPKSRKIISKIPNPKQAVTSIGYRKPVKKDDIILPSIQAKKLFNDGDKSGLVKKPTKPARVVSSRYNQSTIICEARKRPLLENGKEEST